MIQGSITIKLKNTITSLREKDNLRILVRGDLVTGKLFLKVVDGYVKRRSLFMIGTVVIVIQFPKTLKWLETGTE